MDKNKQSSNQSSGPNSANTSTAPSIKPLPKPGKPMRHNSDKREKSNDEFPSAL